ncbi:hypothetical protein PV325_003325 [Microctonus aethiopoides]|uniref:E3 ubiquitin-protein ligase CHFR n=1 Tax=Microctonus aethiopoides TaxID=144406 RepID=A0AA39F0X9_9HYME|nr:hypothetical protein PV326_011625 [Microctonus aethiopoides]KAK0077891.1 hypothetical protein PV325_003325 [Microctonus aethiopoides]KAK0160516.1 hypothetical protein PV328_007920 [Microctonus aethiopoides]
MSSITRKENDEDKLSPDIMIILVKHTKENVQLRDIYVNKNKFKIGRAIECDELILSPSISRNHCILIYKNEQWTITDLSSTHTILNDKILEHGVPENINVGDIIQLSEHEDFKFTVTMFTKDEPEKKKSRLAQSLLDEEIEKQKLFAEEQELKRQELEKELIEKQNEQEELKTRLDDILKSQQAAEGKNEKLNEMIKALEEKIKSGNEIELKMQQNYNNLLAIVDDQQKKFDQRLNEERNKWQQTLEMTNQEKAALEKRMAEQMTAWREKQQTEWNNVVDKLVQQEKDKQTQLINEKELLEQKLKEANDALKEKTTLAEELKNSAQNQQVIVVEVASNEKLDTIDLTKDDEASTSDSSNIIVDKVGNIMDEQLTCQICSELFVTAVTLNCSHTYCQYCIYLWMQTKRDCPICRGIIISVTRSLVLDNFIEQMVNDLSTQHKDRRKDLCSQRKVLSQRLGVPSILKSRPQRGKKSR